MKLLLLCLALVAVALCQDDTNLCQIEHSWSVFQTTSPYVGGLWEDQELVAWGMDGDNKFNDFWKYRAISESNSNSHYTQVTCGDLGTIPFNQERPDSIPNYVMNCGDCGIGSTSSSCNCYPYYDVAGSWKVTAAPDEPSGETPDAPSGWPNAYANANPPYQSFPANELPYAWTLENCKQYQPYYVYYYTYTLKISNNGEFYKSLGISRAFQPSDSAWDSYCDMAFPGSISSPRQCYVPTFVGGTSMNTEQALFGADYEYQMGFWRENELTSQVQFFHYHFENGCHMKAREHRFPTASYCADDSGWTFGAGTTGHVRFGCDTSTFQDTATDAFDIDDGDCSSVYLQFDHMNPMTNVVDEYDTNNERQAFGANPFFYTVRDQLAVFDQGVATGTSGQCYYKSSFIDHRSNIPNYRTPCNSGGVLAIPFLALLTTLFVALRNMY